MKLSFHPILARTFGKTSILLGAFLGAVLALSDPPVQAQSSLYKDSTEIRESAILTASDVLSTTFTVPQDVKAVHFYVDFTKGSLTDATFAPAGAKDGNPAATGYYKAAGYSQTLAADGRLHWRVPREALGAYQYAGVFAVGTGTATSSTAAISYKLEY